MYHVGSKNEDPNRTGFARFFEHLVFEGSGNIKRGEFNKYRGNACATNKMLIEVSVAGMGVMNKQVSDGSTLAMTQQNQKIPIDAATMEKGLYEAALFPEANLAQLKAKASLKGIEAVEGKDAYVVEVIFPLGGKIIHYYDTKTGLKLQTVQFGQGPQGEVSIPTQYENYKEVNGVKFPQTMLQSMGPMKLKFEIITQETNPKLEDSLFKTE